MTVKKITLVLFGVPLLIIAVLCTYNIAYVVKDNEIGDLTPLPSVYIPLVLKPDTSLIAFNSNRDGLSNIYIMNTDGTNPVNLTNNNVGNRGDFGPAWSPDGSMLAFMSDRDNSGLPGGNGFEIYTMFANGTGLTRLTFNQVVDQFQAWSPDGNKIAFASNRDTNDGSFRVYTMNTDGSNVVKLTNLSGNAPSWSPDGSQIAFTSNRDGNYEIYKMNSDGSNQVRLTNNPAPDSLPAWSPDGNKIAFQSGRDGNFEIYTMNIDGSAQTRLTDNSATESSMAWSPDSTKIAFTSLRDGNAEIYIMSSDGSDQINLTKNPADDFNPSWSLGN